MTKKKNHNTYINTNLDSKDLLNIEHFSKILDQALDEIRIGKGSSRHGKNSTGDINFSQQPWRYITDGVGTGFLLGQAIKKLIESKAYHEKLSPTEEQMISWKREALGAVVYIVMAIMWYENKYIELENLKDDNRDEEDIQT